MIQPKCVCGWKHFEQVETQIEAEEIEHNHDFSVHGGMGRILAERESV